MSDLIRVKTFGARHFGGQVNRIDAGFSQLGLGEPPTGTPADLIYANDEPRWQEAIDYREKEAPQAKLILNTLDLAEWNLDKGYNPYTLLPTLRRADAVTSISQYTQSQLRRYYDMDSTVIYNPIKDITPTKRRASLRPYPYRVLLAGRLNDPSKRVRLAIQSLILAGFNESEVVSVGSDKPGFGVHLGVVTDDVLNDLYNSVEYVMMTSVGEGLGLPGLESLAGGAIPIICHDLTTAHEWYPTEWMCYPNPHSIAYRLRLLMDNRPYYDRDQKHALFLGDQVRDLLSGKAVAQRILNVYQTLIKT